MNAGKPPSRDWRAQPPAQSVYAREWRGGPGESKSRFSKTFKVRAMFLTLAVILGLIVYLLAPVADRVPETQILAFGIGAYGGRATPTGNMPVNPFGERDARAFDVLSEQFPDQYLPVRQEDNALNGAQLLSFLEQEAQSPAVAGRNLIVFCTLHGLVQPSGNVELFAIDAAPDSPSSSGGAMIPLDDIVDRLRRSSARRVLLALDASRLQSDWRLGILANDVAAQAAAGWPPASAAGSTQKQVAILLAASSGQTSWPAGEQSAFAKSLVEGLSGSADGWVEGPAAGKTGPQDRRISLQELAAFVRGNVESQVRQKYGARQTVQLVGDVTDFDVAVVSEPRPAVTAKDSKADAKADPADKAQTAATEAAKPAADAPPPAPKAPPGVKWETRLAEMRSTRDGLRDSGREALIRRRMPFAWRSWEAQIDLVESLVRGGLSDLAPAVVLRADALEKTLLTATGATGLPLPDGEATQRTALRDLGFSADPAPPSRDALAAAGKYLQGLAAGAPPPTPPATPPAATSPAAADAIPNPSTIQFWLRQQMFIDPSSRNWGELRKIVAKLNETGAIPPTVEALVVRDALLAEAGETRYGTGDGLRRLLGLRDRCRRLAVDRPDALPLVRTDIQNALHALAAAERWLLIAGSGRPETLQWLDQAEKSIASCEAASRKYVDTLELWTNLLIELPSYAAWIAARANDDPRRSADSANVRAAARQWAEFEQNGQWAAPPVVTAWPDRPARWTDPERKLLTLFVDVQRLKRVLFAENKSDTSSAALSDLVQEISLHRRDLLEEINRSLPRLGTADSPTPQVWQEANRLLAQTWTSSEDRRSLEALCKLAPQGDTLPDRNLNTEAVWQGFWAVATLSLLSRDFEDTGRLWKEWDRLAELSGSTDSTSASASESENDALRKRRADLGRSVRLTWRNLQEKAGALRTTASTASWQLVAATLDPTLIPDTNPDTRILDEESRQFSEWLTVFAADWDQRSWNEKTIAWGGRLPDRMAWELAGAPRRNDSAIPAGLNEIETPKFDATRRAKLVLSAGGSPETGAARKIFLTGPSVRLSDAPGQNLATQSAARNVPAAGPLSLDLKLDDAVETAQKLLVVLTETDGFPVDFREVALQPPFDPSAWRVEFVEAKTGAALQTSTLSNPKGIKLFLPPAASVSLKASLIRPARDNTPAVKISIFRLGESSRVPLLENVELKLEAGQEKTAILTDLPPPVDPKDAPKEKDAAPPEPLADLAHGWLFEITPEGQAPIEYVVRPSLWSATHFMDAPQPVLRDDRFIVELQRRAEAKDDVLLPPKIPVELRVPLALRSQLTDFTLGGPVGPGQKLTLSFALPADWRDQVRRTPWDLSLDIAGLPHAFRWRLDATGTLTPVGGQPPQLAARLIFPPPEPKAPPRLAPIVRRGKEPLHLLFEVDAAALDRTEDGGDWSLSYTVVRETDDGAEATPLQHSWRLFSSVERHVFLDSIQRGKWNLTTTVRDYETIEPESEIQGLAGRFRVNAVLTQASDRDRPAATASLRFAIDDDASPDLAVKGLATAAHLTDRDLPFRIEASDQESGIERVMYGFDANADKVLQPEETMETRTLIGFDNPTVSWPVMIPKLKLPKLEKDEETKQLLVQAINSGGAVAAKASPVTLKKPVVVLPKKATKGTLVVNMQISKGGKSSIQITGPDARLEQTDGGSITFKDLTPGQYTVTVNVNYAVIGRKEKGEAKVDVKAGETTTAAVPLSQSK